jgi:hypothetical protein
MASGRQRLDRIIRHGPTRSRLGVTFPPLELAKLLTNVASIHCAHRPIDKARITKSCRAYETPHVKHERRLDQR